MCLETLENDAFFSKFESKMGPKWLQNGSKIAPQRPLGGPGAPRSIFERFVGRFWAPFWF